jgi:nucleotide-binding universal stress UspA family protein
VRSVDRVLLASHGTRGAQAAESAALELCAGGATLAHLCVVPELWHGMMGDDWLNNAATRERYGKHVEAELSHEIDVVRARLEGASRARGLEYEHRTVIGDPALCLVAYAAEFRPGLIVIGAPRPARTPGLRSRMKLETLVKSLKAPLLVAPYPE